MKKCPYCAESIKDEAIKCRYCKSMLDGNVIKQDGKLSANEEPKKTERSITRNEDDYGFHLENMETYEKGAVEVGKTLKDFLLENVGVQESVALELLQSYKPKINFNEKKQNVTKCVNCSKEMSNIALEGILADVGLMCKACYAKREGLMIEEVERIGGKQKNTLKKKSDTIQEPIQLQPEKTKKTKPEDHSLKMNIVKNNAYRILGLSVDASKRDIARRVEEIQMFIKIGQTPQYDTDFSWIGELNRDEEAINKSLRVLGNPKKKLEQLISWFWIIDENDKLAVDALKINDIDKALEIWSDTTCKHPNYHKKNLAMLEQILIHQELDNDYQHLKNFVIHWIDFISCGEFYLYITSLDKEVSNYFTITELLDVTAEYLGKIIVPFLKIWSKKNQGKKLREFFVILNGSGLPKKFVNYLIKDYVGALTEQIEESCSEFSSVDDYHNTKVFYAKVNIYYNQLKQTGDTYLIESYGDKIGKLILENAIAYGNKTKQWGKSKELCELAETFISGDLLKSRLDENSRIISDNTEQEKFWKDLQPINAAPNLGTINGIGTTLYGNSNYDPDSKSYETTEFFTILYIPIFPISRYRVIETSNNYYQFLGKLPFRTEEKVHLAVVLIAIALIILFSLISSQQENSNPYSSKVNSKPPSSSIAPKPYRTKSSKTQEINALKEKINSKERRLKAMESEMSPMVETLDNYKNTMDNLNQEIEIMEEKMERGLYVNDSIWEDKINKYNDLLSKGQTVYSNYKTKEVAYDKLLKSVNEDIDRYNLLIK